MARASREVPLSTTRRTRQSDNGRSGANYDAKLHPMDEYTRPAQWARRHGVVPPARAEPRREESMSDDETDDESFSVDTSEDEDPGLEGIEVASPRHARLPDPKATRRSQRSAAQVVHEYRSHVHPNDGSIPGYRHKKTRAAKRASDGYHPAAVSSSAEPMTTPASSLDEPVFSSAQGSRKRKRSPPANCPFLVETDSESEADPSDIFSARSLTLDGSIVAEQRQTYTAVDPSATIHPIAPQSDEIEPLQPVLDFLDHQNTNRRVFPDEDDDDDEPLPGLDALLPRSSNARRFPSASQQREPSSSPFKRSFEDATLAPENLVLASSPPPPPQRFAAPTLPPAPSPDSLPRPSSPVSPVPSLLPRNRGWVAVNYYFTTPRGSPSRVTEAGRSAGWRDYQEWPSSARLNAKYGLDDGAI